MLKDANPTIEFQIDIIIEPDEDGFHAYCPALKGLHTCGDTEEEALSNAKDAAIAYLHSLIKHGDPIPIGIIAGKTEETKEIPPRNKSHLRHHIAELAVVAR